MAKVLQIGGDNMEQDAKLKTLANEVMTTLFAKPKQKKLRPLVKQLTYKGITKKWTYDGTFLTIVGAGHSYDWELYSKAYGYNTIEEAIKGIIEKEEK